MRQRTVLLIASNPREVQRTQRNFEEAGLHHTLRVVSNGEEALAYLRREGVYTDPRQAPRPDVVVLATSLRPDEVCQVYAAGANAYLRKPVEGPRFTEVVGPLGRFWLETAELPPDA